MSDDLRDLYQDLILDHGKKPRNFRVPADANRQALGHNPLCGEKIDLFITVDEDGVIRDAAFQGSGCAISVASASLMTDMIKGKTATEAARLFDYLHKACTTTTASAEGLDEDDVLRIGALSGVRDYPVRVKCATLAWRTLQSALADQGRVATE